MSLDLSEQENVSRLTNAIEITDWNELDEIRSNPSGEYVLAADLDSGTAGFDSVASASANDGDGFNPIENFSGVFDGQGYTIADFVIDRSGETQVGLFGTVGENGVVSDTVVENASVTGSGQAFEAGVGVLVGYNQGDIASVTVGGEITEVDIGPAGGVAGANDGTVLASIGTTDVDGTIAASPLVGYNTGTVTKSKGDGSAVGDTRAVGPVVGRNDGLVNRSLGQGSVLSPERVGGVVGDNTFSILGEVRRCYTAASVSVGTATQETEPRDKSWKDSDAITEQSSEAGGIAGLNDDGTIEIAYWDQTDSGTGQSEPVGTGDAPGEATGLNTAEMQGDAAADNMPRLDFVDIWETVTDPADYPTLQALSGTVSPGTGPTAVIAVSTGTVTSGETVSFSAGGSVGEIDSYEWKFGDGTTDTGESVTHSYDQTEDYVTELTVVGDGGFDTTTTDIAVVSDGDVAFSVQPASPVVGDKVTFEGTGGTSYEWALGDGATATGEQVVHEYDSPGSYDVTLTVDGETVTNTVDVSSTDISITEITRKHGGVPFKSVSYEDTFNATVSSSASIEEVKFELGDELVVDTSSEGWSATFDLGMLDGTDVLTVTAVDENGVEATRERTVPIQQVPEWLEWLIDQGEVTVTESETRIDIRYAPFELDTYSFDLGGIPVDVEPPEFDGAPKAEVGYETAEQAAILGGDGEINTNLFGYGFGAELAVEGAIDSNLALVSASGSASVSLAVQVGPPLYVDLPPGVPCLDDRIGIETTVEPNVDLDANFDGQLQFQDGTVQPGTDITVGGQLSICGAGAGASVTGGLSASFDVGTEDPNLSGTISVSGEIWVDLSVLTIRISVEESVTLPADTNTLVVSPSVEDVEWYLAEKHGSNPSLDLPSVDDASPTTDTVLQPAAGGTNSYGRLTDRDKEDTQPSVTTFNGDTLVAWSRQDADKPVEAGRDIAFRIRQDGSWSDTIFVTDSTRSNETPAVAATSDAILAAWEYVDTDIDSETSPSDIHPHVEIAYAIYDGTSWSDPTVVTDSDAREFQPTVAADGDGWLLAWERDTDPEPGTGERSVRYVRVDSTGTAGSIADEFDAAYPSAGPHADGAVLGFAKLTDGSPKTVASALLTDGTETDRTTFTTADPVTSVTAAEDRVVWQQGPVNDPDLREGNRETATVQSLTVRESIDAIAEPTLATAGDEAVLAYRAYVDSGDTRKLVYRLNRGNGWIFDRQFVQPPTTDEDVWQPNVDLPSGADTFTTAFAVTENIEEGKNDVLVADHDFLPEYAIRADGPAATAGDEITIDYEVTNRGDIAGTQDVDLTVSNQAGTQATVTLSPLNPGETVTGQVTVTVDETGEFSLSLDTTEQSLSTAVEPADGFESGGTTLTVATADLSVAAINTLGAETVEIVVENTGSAAAFDVPIAISDGTTELTTATIETIGIGETSSTTVTIDPASIDRNSEDRIILDPDGTHEQDVSDTEQITPTWLLQPNLFVTDEIRYESTLNNGLVARVVVGNESPVSGSGTLRAVHNGEIIGQTAIQVAGTDSAVYQTVTLPLDGTEVIDGNEVRFEIDPDVPDADSSSTAVSDDIGPVFVEPASLTQQWAFELVEQDQQVGLQHAQPATDSQRVYVGGLGTDFYALNRDGTDRIDWVETRDGALSDSAPRAGDGLVIVGSGGGVLYAFDPDADADRTVWTYEINSAITSSPAIRNGTVYVGANDGTVHAVTDGSRVWQTSVGSPVYSTVAADDQHVFVTTDDGDVVGLDSETGTEQWRFETGTSLGASGPAVDNGTVYVAADKVYALEASTGNMAWSDPVEYGGTAGATPTVANGHVYIGSASGIFHALDASDGSESWHYEADGGIAADPAVNDGRVVVATLNGTVSLLDEDTGLALANKSVGDAIRAPPALSEFEVFVGSEAGEIDDLAINQG